MTSRNTPGRWLLATTLVLCGCGEDTPGEAGDAPVVEVGAVVITELMPNVEAASVDWLELYNATDTAIDLEGCVVSDDGTDRFDIAAPLVIEPGQYAVLAASDDASANAPPALASPAYVFSDVEFRLEAPGPDQVVLTCGDRVVDRTDYAEYRPGPATGTRGWQIDPSALAAGSASDATWCYTPLPVITEDYVYGQDSVASPGVENPPCNVFPYTHYEQAEVLIEGIDLAATLEIARIELAAGGGPSVLTVWAIRDQVITAEIAGDIAGLYAQHVDGIYGTDPVGIYDWNFGVWHYAWAISNLYRNGSAPVRAALQAAYDDALGRPETLDRFRLVAIDHVRGNRVLMGDIHEGGRMYARTHIVAPGNPDYLQSLDDYFQMQARRPNPRPPR